MTKFGLNLLFPLLCLLLCLRFPTVCAEGVRRGLHLSLEAALPALFPSLVLSAILTRQMGNRKEKSFLTPFLLGLLCGFPIGAASVASLVKEGKISIKDGEKLLFFCNNAGPAFLISYCGETILGDQKKGIFLFLLQAGIAFLCLLFFFGKRLFRKEKNREKNANKNVTLGRNFPVVLRESTYSFLYIMSCVIFFSFVTELICHLLRLRGISAMLLGLFTELCGGVERLRYVGETLAFPLCALGCGWGGCSVLFQTAGILEGSGLSIKKYLWGKTFFAITLFLLTVFLQKLL